jgi:hypothetical protein
VRCTLGHPAVTKPFADSRSVGLGWGGIRTSTGSTSGQSLADTPTQYSGCVHAAWLGPVRGEIRSGVVEVSGGHVGGEQGCVVEEWSGGGERASALARSGEMQRAAAFIEYQLHRVSACDLDSVGRLLGECRRDRGGIRAIYRGSHGGRLVTGSATHLRSPPPVRREG